MSDIVQIQKMVFIYNAVLAGWTVRMLDENTFEFQKNRNNQSVNLDEYLRRFVSSNLNIDSLTAPPPSDSPNSSSAAGGYSRSQ